VPNTIHIVTECYVFAMC